MRDKEYLFCTMDWFSVDQHQRKLLADEVAELGGDRLLNTSVDDLCAYLEAKYRVDVPTLRRDEIVADQRETQIDVSGDRRRYISDRGRPFYVPATAVEVSIPFDGDAEAFRIRPTSYTSNPPRGRIGDRSLILKVEGTDLSADRVRAEIDATIAEVETYLQTLRGNAEGLNSQLNGLARGAIEQRRKKLLADRSLVASLGFKIRERESSVRTFAPPEVRRKIVPSLPPASAKPYKPEPALLGSDYEHILNVLQNMAHVMERSPSAFVGMDEESLRTHFLVQLNGHYEGQATGETFNYEGKTDILVRSEGRNIFIGECKFWGGAKKLTETLDQLLGYSSWRDTKVAIIVFNKNKDFSNVLASIRETAAAHPNCKRDLGPKSETESRFVFAHKDDPNREMLVAILAFDVPT